MRGLIKGIAFILGMVAAYATVVVVNGCDNGPPSQPMTMDQIIASDHFKAELTKISENPEVFPFYGIRVDGTELWAFKCPDGTMRGFWLSQSEAQLAADEAKRTWLLPARTDGPDTETGAGLIPVIITK
jgi:hypothetical protein